MQLVLLPFEMTRSSSDFVLCCLPQHFVQFSLRRCEESVWAFTRLSPGSVFQAIFKL